MCAPRKEYSKHTDDGPNLGQGHKTIPTGYSLKNLIQIMNLTT